MKARTLSLTSLAAFLVTGAFAQILPPGTRPSAPSVHALIGAKIVVKPGTVIDSGIIIIRNGLIEAVGANVAVPPDARVWDHLEHFLQADISDSANGDHCFSVLNRMMKYTALFTKCQPPPG